MSMTINDFKMLTYEISTAAKARKANHNPNHNPNHNSNHNPNHNPNHNHKPNQPQTQLQHPYPRQQTLPRV